MIRNITITAPTIPGATFGFYAELSDCNLRADVFRDIDAYTVLQSWSIFRDGENYTPPMASADLPCNPVCSAERRAIGYAPNGEIAKWAIDLILRHVQESARQAA